MGRVWYVCKLFKAKVDIFELKNVLNTSNSLYLELIILKLLPKTSSTTQQTIMKCQCQTCQSYNNFPSVGSTVVSSTIAF